MNIYEAIADIMKEGYAISKNKRNQQQGFMYRGIDDVMNTFQPLMAERGIFLVPEVLNSTREERQTNKGNQINAIQGFNQVTQAINGLGSDLRQSISQLGYQLESCCCSIKTQMLQDKYEALENLYRSAQTDISNAAQTQTLLNTMGKWVANPAATAA